MTLHQELCRACGMCCDGSFFVEGHARGDEVRRLEGLGLPVAGEPPTFPQPCACLRAGQCTIYPERPFGCREFKCSTLRQLQAGAIPLEQAWARLHRARRLADEVWRHLAGFRGPLSVRIGAFDRSIRRSQDVLGARLRYKEAYKAIAEFTLLKKQWFSLLDPP